jgi:hypothetical protein
MALTSCQSYPPPAHTHSYVPPHGECIVGEGWLVGKLCPRARDKQGCACDGNEQTLHVRSCHVKLKIGPVLEFVLKD